MIKEYLELGQIVGTHGVRGEMRFNPWADSPAFAAKFRTLFTDANGSDSVKVISRVHGNVVLMKMEGVDSVEKAASLKNKVLFMKRSDADLPDGTWFVQELIGCHVFDVDTGTQYGILSDVSETGANDVWHITDSNGKEYLLPAIKQVIIETDVAENRILIRPMKGIFEDAD